MRMTSMNEREATWCGTRPVGRCSRPVSTYRRGRSDPDRATRRGPDSAATDVTDLDARHKTITSELASLVTAQKSTANPSVTDSDSR